MGGLVHIYQVDFCGTRGSQPDALRDHSGTLLGPKKSFLAIFTTMGWKSGSRVLLGRFSEWSRVPISIFSGRLGIRER